MSMVHHGHAPLARRSRVLFIDHVGVLGGAELALFDVVCAYRHTSTVLLFADAMLTRAPAATLVLAGRSALDGERAERLRDWAVQGRRVEYVQADVSRRDAVQALVTRPAAEHTGELA